MDLIQFLRTLYKYVPLLILLPLITMIITFIFVQNSEREFRARAVVSSGFIESQNTPGNERRISRDQVMFQYANLMELLSSKNVYDFVTYALLKHDMENPDQAFRPFGEAYDEMSPQLRASVLDSLNYALDNYRHLSERNGIGSVVLELALEKDYDYEKLQERINVRRMGQSDYIQVTAETEDPVLSAFIANRFASHFINFYRISQNRLLGVNIEFYLEQVRLREEQLEERTQRLQNFKVQNSITNITEQTKALAIQMTDFERVREREMRNYMGAQSLIDSLNVVLQQGGDGYVEGSVAELNSEVAIARRSMAELNRRRVNAQVRGNTELAAELEAQIDQERQRLQEAIEVIDNQSLADPRVARQQLLSQRLLLSVEAENSRQALIYLESELERLQNKTREFARMEAVLDAYVRQINLAEQDYLSMLDRLNQFRLRQQAMSSGSQMEQVEAALPPTDPMPSKKLIILVVAGAGSFAFALVAVFIVEYLDLTIRNAQNLANRTHKPVFGVIPELRTDEVDIPSLFSSEHATDDALSKATASMIRLLRHNLLSETEGKRLLLSSPHPRTGKTFVSVFMAYAIAQANYRVLLIDTGTRDHALTTQFGAEPSLERFLRGEISPAQAAVDTTHPLISIIGCASTNKTISEMASQSQIKKAMEEVAEEYDIVLIDSTPLIKENNARELLPFVDSVTLVFSALDVINGVDASVISELNEAKTSFKGTVLNKVDVGEIEHIYGELDKERNFVRRAFKEIIRGNVKGAFRRDSGLKASKKKQKAEAAS